MKIKGKTIYRFITGFILLAGGIAVLYFATKNMTAESSTILISAAVSAVVVLGVMVYKYKNNG